jgi:hypothetical protein
MQEQQLREQRGIVLGGQPPLGARQLRDADQVDLVRHYLPGVPSETAGVADQRKS